MSYGQRGRVLLGMSGGVDSSVSAVILKKLGYEVIGVTMKIWDDSLDPVAGSACYSPAEPARLEETARVADSLGIPFHVIDLVDEYKREVVDYFTAEYLAGRTPNPCVFCNKRVKFGFLQRKARESNIPFDFFATGHYARISAQPDGGRFQLQKGVDVRKDQSYFLVMLDQEQLSRTVLPMGYYTKKVTRQIARDCGLNVAEKKESQDFITPEEYSFLFGDRVKPGPIVDEQGNTLGEHRGIIFYTVGQRRGMGVAAPHPLYVVRIDPRTNTIVAGPKEAVYSSTLTASRMNWVSIYPPPEAFRALVKIRYNHPGALATLTVLDCGNVLIQFDNPQAAITPGQLAVFYEGDLLIGGGVIS